MLYFRGTFRMEREDGYAFDCRIPPFSLESKIEKPPTDMNINSWTNYVMPCGKWWKINSAKNW